jgi:glycosyltransferase involved in cell wall biosynthesis
MQDSLNFPRRGSLDGLTVLRYAQIYEERGGIEEYLRYLNRILSERSAMTTILVHLTCKHGEVEEITVMPNGSRLVRVPLFVRKEYDTGGGSIQKSKFAQLAGVKRILRSSLMSNRLLRPTITSLWRRWRKVHPCQDYEPEDVQPEIERLIRRFNINLFAVHSQGGNDTFEVITGARRHSIPVIIQNHFANERFCHFAIAEEADLATGVSGVSAIGLPKYLRERFVNLSDAIDLDFFDPERAEDSPFESKDPLLVMSGRITPAKGQLDAIEVVRRLRDSGLKPQMVFAGHIDSPGFLEELKRCAAGHGLEKQIRFAGCLTQVELRNLYKSGSLFILPTRHQEGLPRVVLEAQAMKIPPVVYDVGGTAGAVVPGSTGILIKKGDISGFVQAVAKLLKSENLRRQMGEAGRRYMGKNFSLPSLAKRHEEYYLKIIKSVKPNASA